MRYSLLKSLVSLSKHTSSRTEKTLLTIMCSMNSSTAKYKISSETTEIIDLTGEISKVKDCKKVKGSQNEDTTSGESRLTPIASCSGKKLNKKINVLGRLTQDATDHKNAIKLSSKVDIDEVKILHEGSAEYISLTTSRTVRSDTNSQSKVPKIKKRSKRILHGNCQDTIDKSKFTTVPEKHVKIEQELGLSDSSDDEFKDQENVTEKDINLNNSPNSPNNEVPLEDCSDSESNEQNTEKNDPKETEMVVSEPKESISVPAHTGSSPQNILSQPTNWQGIEYHIPIDVNALQRRQCYESNRQWVNHNMKPLSKKQCAVKDECEFIVLNYNVLAPSIVPSTIDLYKNTHPTYLSWRYRWHLFQYELRKLLPDIITLQEVDVNLYHSHYLPWLTQYGFKGLYKQRTNGKNDGCAIFYRNDLFSLIESCSVEYFQSNGGQSLNRDNIGLIAKLSPVKFDAPFCVATTHLLFNPRRTDVRLAQMTLLLTELDRICYLEENKGYTKYCPLVITGDFNSPPSSSVVQFVIDGVTQHQLSARNNTFYRSYAHQSQGNQIIPKALGITSRCQHAALEQNRYLERRRGPIFSLSDKRKIEENLIKLDHSERSTVTGKSMQDHESAYVGQSSVDSWYHNFELQSVYDLKEPIVSANHDMWINVDYIFYSKSICNNVSNKKQMRLALCSSLKLPNSVEADFYGPLPSDICPSDHFPLCAKFKLSTTET